MPGEVEGRLEGFLRGARRIAVVGVWADPERENHRAAVHLLQHGYEVVPVGSGATTVAGRPVVPRLEDVRGLIDLVDFHGPRRDLPEIAAGAIAIRAPVLWLELGVIDERAAQRARAAGVEVVMDRSVRSEHRRLVARSAAAR